MITASSVKAAATAADQARKAAETADDAVVELIRTELQGKGQPLGDWQAFPAPDPTQGLPR